jgi:hypothetical protein
MKTRVMLMVAMLALSAPVFADTDCGSGNDYTNPGRANPKCNDNGGDPRDNGNGGNVNQGQAQGQLQGQAQLQAQGQLQSQTAVATAVAQSVNTNTNSASVGDVTATGGNATATGGDATATGGAGGQAVSAAVVESGAATAVVESGAVQYTYTERLQAPAIGQGSFAISGCGVAGNAGGSGPGWAGFLGFGFTPPQCYDFMLAQAYQSIGEKKAVCDILKASKAGQRQLKRGITLPECAPEVVAVPVPERVVEKVVEKVYVEVPPAKISE